jgi:UDP-glucose 4-epimerase
VTAFDAVLNARRIDAVVHFATLANVSESGQRPAGIITSAFYGTVTAAQRYGVRGYARDGIFVELRAGRIACLL